MEIDREHDLKDDTDKSIMDKIGSGATGLLVEPDMFKMAPDIPEEVTDTPTQLESGTNEKAKVGLGIVIILLIAAVGIYIVFRSLKRK